MERTQGGGTVLISQKAKKKPKQQEEKVIRMKLKAEKQVRWTEDTIDNEHMNKRKSKSKSNLTYLPVVYSLLHLRKSEDPS